MTKQVMTQDPAEILMAQPRGFCAGVDRAINIVDEALIRFGAPIYVRHELRDQTSLWIAWRRGPVAWGRRYRLRCPLGPWSPECGEHAPIEGGRGSSLTIGSHVL